jgi:hypothetical protein
MSKKREKQQQREKREGARMRARFIKAAAEIRRAIRYSIVPPSRLAEAVHEVALRQYARESDPAVWVRRYRSGRQ